MLRSFRVLQSCLPSLTLMAVGLLGALPACSASGTSQPETIGTTAQAETPDTFGFGSGRSGAFSVTLPDTAVNTYAPITGVDATGTKITVGALQGATNTFGPGDLLLVWRTTGLAATTPGTQTVVTLTTDVGAYELARVKSFAGGVLTVTNPLSTITRYTVGSQVVRVPEYTTLTVLATAGIKAYAWDGSSGGIVAFFATGAVTNAGAVSADGAGFRGGGLENDPGSPLGCTALTGDDNATPCGGAHKGEGLFPGGFALAATTFGADPSATYGYGNDANGAGGGDSHSGGGGGGGGFGQGGVGGKTWIGDGSRAFGGLGGAAIAYDPTTAFLALGGGGGAADEDNGAGTAGGAGGGVVLVRAGSIVGTGVFSAQGASVITPSGIDGAGGGGAGGAIVLLAAGTVACTSALASGGAGGSGAIDPDGPGGGGGGGLVFVQSAAGATCPVVALGGPSGLTTTVDPGFTNTAYGATAGAVGVATAGGAGASTKTACSPAQLATNLCGGCVVDADCPANKVCDTGKNTCSVCNATEQGSCSGNTAACNSQATGADTCIACNANFGTVGATHACLTASAPACVLTGTNAGSCTGCNTSADCTNPALPACSLATNLCVICDGDNGSGAPAACPGAAEPYCTALGACGRCATDQDCDGHSAGPVCSAITGTCGTACTTDAQCGGNDWCDNLTAPGGVGVCEPLVSNGQPVPGGTCTAAIGKRACLAGVCDADNLCGLENGHGPCGQGDSGASVCRSGACPTTGANADVCEECVTSATCTGKTPVCSAANTCVGCSATNTTACSGTTPLCDTTTSACVACNGDNGSGATLACPNLAAPFCSASGSCGNCSSSSDCIGATHTGAVCDRATGACGTTCLASTDCASSQYCTTGSDGGPGTCTAKLPDGSPLPTTPASLATCTPAVGIEVCASGVCTPIENVCGATIDAGADAGQDAGVDAGHDAGHDAGLDAGVTISGGSVSCDVHGGPASSGRGMWLFGLALAGTIAARRRREV